MPRLFGPIQNNVNTTEGQAAQSIDAYIIPSRLLARSTRKEGNYQIMYEIRSYNIVHGYKVNVTFIVSHITCQQLKVTR